MSSRRDRDDFPARVVREMRERAANICSRCGVSTLAPQGGPRGVLIQGVAAHIYAAAPAGPRAAPHLSPEQRSDYDNGIWLCNGCANLVDRDSLYYPAEALRAMKARREAEARETLGRRPGEKEGQHQMLAAISGFASLTTAPSLIPNAHRAMEIALARLDPRLKVTTSHVNGRTNIAVEATEPVSFTLMAPLARWREWQDALAEVLAHGSGRFELRGAQAEGSGLLAWIVGEAASMEISVWPRLATLRLDLEQADGEVWPFVQTEGELVAGSTTAHYSGSALAGLFSIQMPIAMSASAPWQSLSFDVDFARWAGRRLTEIPFTAKINAFCEKLQAGWRPRLILEVEGVQAFSILGNADAQTVTKLDYYRYLYACVRLAERAGSSARFEPSTSISRRNFDEAIEARDQHDPLVHLKGSDFARPIMVKCPATSFWLDPSKPSQDLMVRGQESVPQTVLLFGQPVALARRQWLCGKARLVPRDDVQTEPGFKACELLLDDEAPVTMRPIETAPPAPAGHT